MRYYFLNPILEDPVRPFSMKNYNSKKRKEAINRKKD